MNKNPNVAGTKFFIRCKVDGEQRLAKPLRDEETARWLHLKETGNTAASEEYARQLAEKHFPFDPENRENVKWTKGQGL